MIRIPNLLYIILTQLLLYYCIIEPVYSITGHTLSLSSYEFALLVFSTVCIAAAGYIINDYFDVQADEINKPERIFINRSISRRAAILWHLFFNALGIALGFYLAVRVGVPRLGFIHVGGGEFVVVLFQLFQTKISDWQYTRGFAHCLGGADGGSL
ncbi:MAG: UbiA family prenyltransferase [Sphingobacteriales bacterium]|nr:UbiA family prenyltransferase [Sphingobacteriales bacterium]